MENLLENLPKATFQFGLKMLNMQLKKDCKKNDFILIGSSMGSWIALNLFKNYKKKIKGFIGIGSAPEFLTRLMWNKFPKKIKREIMKKGITIIESG